MNRVFTRLLLVAVLLVSTALPAWSQFGTNKISYESFDWRVYKAPHFDVHYYPALEPFLEEVVSYAESAYLKISKDLDHELRFRVPLIVYKTHGEFLQTNVTLSAVPQGVAAFAEPVQYRMVLPIDQPPDKLYQLIAHELTHIFEFSMFFEGYLGRALRANVPLWIMEGLASYLGEDEDNLDRMAIRDGVVNNILPPVQDLTQLTFLTYRYGHAIFDYVEQEHGIEGLRSFLFEFKKVLLTGNLERAIKESFGYDIDEFNRRFNRYLRKKYYPVLLEKKSPDDYGTEIRPGKSGPVLFSPTLSPSGELIASLAVPKMEYDLVVFPAEGESKVKNLTKGWTNKYREISSVIFEGKRDLSWSPTADQIAVFARRENRWPLLIFNALNGKLLRDIDIGDIFEAASPTFSPDGRRIAFEGNENGVVDIFEIDLDGGDLRNLTQDDFFDANPWYAADGQTLLYNRRIGPHWKIFSVDLSDPGKKSQLTYGPHADIQPSYSRDGKTVFFSSDRGEHGVFNIHSLDLTTGDIRQYTDVVGGCFTPVEMAERGDESFLVFSSFFGGTFRLYRMPLRSPELKIEAAERLTQVAEAAPFEPDLQLTVDESQKVPYKVRWDIEAPSVSVGVTDDGTFLTNVGIQFTDLLGDHRIFVSGASVSDFAQYSVGYANLKHRYNWGGSVFDFRDFFVDQSTGERLEREYRVTGASAFVEYPFNRHYRVRGTVGFQDQTQNQFLGSNPVTGAPVFRSIDDQLAFASFSLVGDTTRYQRFGPFQGKRFNIGVTYGAQLSGDFDGDLLEYRLDLRTYKQLTRRSVLAWRLGTIYNDGDRENIYGFGGLNFLRGWDYREFFGSRIVWSNLEFRFPLVDELRFPVLALSQIRGLFFVDAGAAWLFDDLFYDPELLAIRVEPFDFWDSENNRLQDLRVSYGVGFQFFFLGGLQFNWIWAKRMDYTGLNPLTGMMEKIDGGGTRSEFYIAFDF